MAPSRRHVRFLLLGLGILSLLVAMWAGLVRMGWPCHLCTAPGWDGTDR